MDPELATSEDCPYSRRSCSSCGTSYWADRFDLCPECDERHTARTCGAQYATHARRQRDLAQQRLALAHGSAAEGAAP